MNDDEENQGRSTDEMAAIEEALKEAELYNAKHPIPPGPDPRDEVDRIYTDELLTEIATKYDFKIDKTRFRYWIRSGSIRFYLYNEDIPSRHPSRFAKMRKDLKAQLKAIDRFQKEFDLKTYPPREFKLWTPNPFIEQVERIAYDAMKHQNADQLERDLFDLRRHHHQLETAVAEERHEIEAALEELKSYKGGRPASEGAYEFVAYLSDFWARDLERPYTIDSHQGQGLTEAFSFIQDCAAPLIPISDAQIISMMRKYKSQNRQFFNNLQKPR